MKNRGAPLSQNDTDDFGAVRGVQRSPKWAAFEKRFVRGKACVCCGAKGPLTGHHVIPYHVRPDLELDEANIRPVCTGVDCHLVIGHLKDFRLWNEDFDADAAAFLQKRRRAMALRKSRKTAQTK